VSKQSGQNREVTNRAIAVRQLLAVQTVTPHWESERYTQLNKLPECAAKRRTYDLLGREA